MDRAYTLLDIRSVDEESRVIEGIASTPEPDRMGDIVDPMGAKFALPMPLLWQHQHDKPVGNVEFAKPTKAGIPFKARIAKVEEAGTLKDRVDEAWQSVKSGLVRAVSIGFRALEHSRMESGGLRFISWEWMELSLVTIPANSQAVITAVKSIDQQHLAHEGSAGDAGDPPASEEAGTKRRGAVSLAKPTRKPQPIKVVK